MCKFADIASIHNILCQLFLFIELTLKEKLKNDVNKNNNNTNQLWTVSNDRKSNLNRCDVAYDRKNDERNARNK